MILRKINFILYHLRRMSWVLYVLPSFFSRKKISNKPVFIVGHQGNGATLVSRIIRKSGSFMTVTGGKNYLGGADEMQSVMGLLLPHKFTGIIHKYPKVESFSRRNGWFYASNKFINYFKFDENDYDENDSKIFKLALKTCLMRNSLLKNKFKSRFLDKSQSYLLKIDLIKKILNNVNPKFIIIVRNPLATCWRASKEKTGLSNQKVNLRTRLNMSIEHWNNCFSEIKKHQNTNDVIIFRIEDLVADIENGMAKIFNFIDCSFEKEFLPNGKEKLGYGSLRGERWFPVRKEVNNHRIEVVPDWAKKIILERCKNGMNYFNYN